MLKKKEKKKRDIFDFYSSGNIRPQSSQLAEPLWTAPDIKSGVSVRVLISYLWEKKKKNAGGE